jgi:DNA-3-methyladenine glycosylase II
VSRHLEIRPVAPFDFEHSLAFLGRFEPTAGEQVVGEGSVWKAFRVDGETVAVRVRSTGTVEEPRLTVKTTGSAETDDAADRFVRRWLSTDDDLAEFYGLAADDPAMAPVVERLRGLHQVRFPSPFENAVWAVLAQRIPMRVARRMKQAIVERYGDRVEMDGRQLWAFPEPSDMGTASEAEIQALLGNERRSRAVAAVAQAFNEVDEDWLRTAPVEEVEQWLLAIHGVGTWSAAFVLFRGLGRIERMPITKMMLGAAREVYGPATTQEEAERHAERYGEWQGYWTMYAMLASL